MFTLITNQFYYHSPLHILFIIIHVASALLSLIVAPVAMYVQKGGKNHRRWGRVYLWGMVTSLLCGLVMVAAFHFNIFLLGVTLLTLNGVVTGVRALNRKLNHGTSTATTFDWAFAILVFISGLGLLCWGIFTALGLTTLYIPSNNGLFVIMVILPIIFGVSIISDTWTDFRSFRTPVSDRNWWWYYHMGRMLGSYIGLTTALMVQQVGPRLPDSIAWLVWIAPTLIGTPLISYWISSYRKQFAATSHDATAETGVITNQSIELGVR